MRMGLLADIHANREAFDACLARLRSEDVDRIVILGDVVGYGADPEYVLDAVRTLVEEGAVIVRGNHDQAITDPRESMNAVARAVIDWTRTRLSKEEGEWLAGLPLTARLVDVLITHANGWAPGDFEYMRTTRDAERNMNATREHLTLCGHTHVPALFYAPPMRPASEFKPVPGVAVPLSARLRWVGVIGAVGQPRAGGPQASCAIYDVDQRRLTYHRVPYDAEAAARKVLAAGLPALLAERLLKGR